MALDDNVFANGNKVPVDDPVDNNAVFANGTLISDTDRSDSVFVDGRGLGGEQATITISDSQGSSSGDVVLIARNQTIDDYYGYGSSGDAAASGDIDNFAEIRTTTFYVYENTATDEYSLGYVHDEYRPNNQDAGGEIDFDIGGLPSGASFVVEDDPGNTTSDKYTMSPPTASTKQSWSKENTDGVAIGTFSRADLDGETVTFDVTQYATNNGFVPDTVRFAGDSGTTVSRSYDGTSTTVKIEFTQF